MTTPTWDRWPWRVNVATRRALTRPDPRSSTGLRTPARPSNPAWRLGCLLPRDRDALGVRLPPPPGGAEHEQPADDQQPDAAAEELRGVGAGEFELVRRLLRLAGRVEAVVGRDDQHLAVGRPDARLERRVPGQVDVDLLQELALGVGAHRDRLHDLLAGGDVVEGEVDDLVRG